MRLKDVKRNIYEIKSMNVDGKRGRIAYSAQQIKSERDWKNWKLAEISPILSLSKSKFKQPRSVNANEFHKTHPYRF